MVTNIIWRLISDKVDMWNGLFGELFVKDASSPLSKLVSDLISDNLVFEEDADTWCISWKLISWNREKLSTMPDVPGIHGR